MSDDNAVSRRALLRGASVAGGAALLAVTMAAAPAEAGSMAQKAAGYQPTPMDGKRCDACTFFKVPRSCTLVAGTISPAGWCRFYNQRR